MLFRSKINAPNVLIVEQKLAGLQAATEAALEAADNYQKHGIVFEQWVTDGIRAELNKLMDRTAGMTSETIDKLMLKGQALIDHMNMLNEGAKQADSLPRRRIRDPKPGEDWDKNTPEYIKRQWPNR